MRLHAASFGVTKGFICLISHRQWYSTKTCELQLLGLGRRRCKRIKAVIRNRHEAVDVQISRRDECTYGSQVGEFKMGSIDLQYVASGFSKHIHTEAHPLLDKTHKKMAVKGNFMLVLIQKCDILKGSRTNTCAERPGGQALCSSDPFSLSFNFKGTFVTVPNYDFLNMVNGV